MVTLPSYIPYNDVACKVFCGGTPYRGIQSGIVACRQPTRDLRSFSKSPSRPPFSVSVCTRFSCCEPTTLSHTGLALAPIAHASSLVSNDTCSEIPWLNKRQSTLLRQKRGREKKNWLPKVERTWYLVHTDSGDRRKNRPPLYKIPVHHIFACGRSGEKPSVSVTDPTSAVVVMPLMPLI